MVDSKVITEWVEKANEDLEFARINLNENRPFFAQICFHFQQSAEKYLKAYIISRGLEFRKTHDLLILLKTCSDHDHSFDVLKEACEYLATFYIEARYPVHWPTHFSVDDTKKALQYAEEIQSFVSGILVGDALPSKR
jgi:HEPN domain-containing protein